MDFGGRFYWPLTNFLLFNWWLEDRSPLTCITQSESWSVFTASHTPTGEWTTNLHRHLQYVAVILSAACDLRLISSCLGAAFWLPLEIYEDKGKRILETSHTYKTNQHQQISLTFRSSRYREGNHPATHPSISPLQKHHDLMFLFKLNFGHLNEKNKTLSENTVGLIDSSHQCF